MEIIEKAGVEVEAIVTVAQEVVLIHIHLILVHDLAHTQDHDQGHTLDQDLIHHTHQDHDRAPGHHQFKEDEDRQVFWIKGELQVQGKDRFLIIAQLQVLLHHIVVTQAIVALQADQGGEAQVETRKNS